MVVFDVMYTDEFDDEYPTKYRFNTSQEAINMAESLTLNDGNNLMTYYFAKAIELKK